MSDDIYNGDPVPADELADQLRKRSLGATRLRRWRSAQLMSQAADEIERLRDEIERYEEIRQRDDKFITQLQRQLRTIR